MARLEIDEVVLRRDERGALFAVEGASVLVRAVGGAVATLWDSAVGGGAIPNPTLTDASGRIDGTGSGCWIEEDDCPASLEVTPPVGSELEPYTQQFQPNKLSVALTYSGSNNGIGVYVPSLSADPAAVADWGPLINAAIAGGAKSLIFPEGDYPYSTPIPINGQSSMIVFEGERGRGWYAGDPKDRRGARLVWKGGASPVVTVTDGAITSGAKVLTSATGPWTLISPLHVGQPITVVGAGPAGADLVTVIASWQSATQVTLLDAASTTVAGATVRFTNWTRAIQAQGSTGTTFRDMKLTYDNAAFDGIVLDMRAASGALWAARGELRDCMLYGDLGAQDAYALLHLSGHGEMFKAQDVGFSAARAHVRGQYGMNADDAHFVDCNFDKHWEGAVVNPGRYWKFTNCRGGGSNGATPLRGPFLASARSGLSGGNLTSVELDHCTFWDFGTISLADAAIASGTTALSSASAPFTGQPWYWEGRVVSIAGAGPGGGNLDTRIEKWVSATQVTLRDAASATVAAAAAKVGDGGVLYTKSGLADGWTVYIEKLQTYLGTFREIEMLGPGLISIDHWTTSRNVRTDVVGSGALLNLGNATTDKKTVFIRDILPTSPNLLSDSDAAIINLDGHDLRSVEGVTLSRGFKMFDLLRQESIAGVNDGRGQPALAISAGQTAGITAGVWGNDMAGYITVTTAAGGAIAGNLVDVTFFRPWRTFTTNFATPDRGCLVVQLTPMQVLGSGLSSGNNAVDAGAYYISDNAHPLLNGWTLAIRNAVTGAKTLRWSYRIVRT